MKEKHKKIALQLVKNPRATDTEISKSTEIPLKTVNRLRKELEEKGILNYYTAVKEEPEKFRMITVTFRPGLTKQWFREKFPDNVFHDSYKEIYCSFLGEKGANLSLILFMEGQDSFEHFNASLVPTLQNIFGHDCIIDVENIDITDILRLFKNYLPGVNYSKGKISAKWPDGKLAL